MAIIHTDKIGEITYKYTVNGHWKLHPGKESKDGNHSFIIKKEDKDKFYFNNLSVVRSILNSYSKKLAKKYP